MTTMTDHMNPRAERSSIVRRLLSTNRYVGRHRRTHPASR